MTTGVRWSTGVLIQIPLFFQYTSSSTLADLNETFQRLAKVRAGSL